MVSPEELYLNRDEGQTAGEARLNRLALAESNLRFTLDLIRFADQKAQNLLRITLALFAAAFVGVPPAVLALSRFAKGGGWLLALFVGTIVLYVACSACLLGSMMCIVRVIRPRRKQDSQHKCVLFFDLVAEAPLDDFLRTLRGMDYDSALAEMGTQLHQSAGIARAKYAAVDAAIRWLLHGVLIGIVFALILLVCAGWFLY